MSWAATGRWPSTPEADVLLNASGSGHHANLVDVVGLGRGFEAASTWARKSGPARISIPPARSASTASIWTLAWLPDPNDTQLDGGFDVGLNRATPDLEIYVGFSSRF